MTISNAINNVQFSSVNIVTFTSNGTYTPPANLLYAVVECVAGGGGSGGIVATAAGGMACTGGGGAGGYARREVSKAQCLPNVTVTVGAAGTAGAAGNNAGGTGGTTSFGALSIATGGSGSAGDNDFNGGAGYCAPGGGPGDGTTGDLLVRGAPGRWGFRRFDTLQFGCRGGAGGVAFFGGAGNGTLSSQAGCGAGGVFNLQSAAAQAGLAGASGCCVITEYLGV